MIQAYERLTIREDVLRILQFITHIGVQQLCKSYLFQRRRPRLWADSLCRHTRYLFSNYRDQSIIRDMHFVGVQIEISSTYRVPNVVMRCARATDHTAFCDGPLIISLRCLLSEKTRLHLQDWKTS